MKQYKKITLVKSRPSKVLHRGWSDAPYLCYSNTGIPHSFVNKVLKHYHSADPSAYPAHPYHIWAIIGPWSASFQSTCPYCLDGRGDVNSIERSWAFLVGLSFFIKMTSYYQLYMKRLKDPSRNKAELSFNIQLLIRPCLSVDSWDVCRQPPLEKQHFTGAVQVLKRRSCNMPNGNSTNPCSPRSPLNLKCFRNYYFHWHWPLSFKHFKK